MFLRKPIEWFVPSLELGACMFRRYFAKIYGFKSKYPTLYEHVHPDSRHLFDGDFVDSKTIVKWVCNKGPDHIWDCDIASRVRSFKRRNDFICLFCCGKRVSVTNSLATRYPEIAKEWVSDLNKDLKPTDVTCHSSRDVWWQCPKNPSHKYLMAPNERTLYHQGCPFCSQSSVTKETSLEHLYPSIAAQWDYERNGQLKPSDVFPNYKGKVWWKCIDNPDHHWKCSIAYRTKEGATCPLCKQHKVLGGSLVSLNPTLLKEWDFAKNGDLKPNDISTTSPKMVWWKCEHGVEWKESVLYRNQLLQEGRHRCAQCQALLNKQTKCE